MPSWSQLVCQLCFPASLQRATLPGKTNAGHNQRRVQPTQGIPTEASWRTVAWENLPTGHTVGGGSRVGDMSMRESTRWQAAAAIVVIVVVVVVAVVAVVVAPGTAAGYQCGFCVNAAGPAVQVLGHRVALR